MKTKTRPAYLKVPEKPNALYRNLKPPAAHYGVEVRGLALSITLFVVPLMIGIILTGSNLLALVRASTTLASFSRADLIALIFPLVVGVGFLVGAIMAFLAMRNAIWRRNQDLAEHAKAKQKYVSELLLPYLAARYGVTDVVDASALLRGEAASARINGEPTRVILLESVNGESFVELGYADKKENVEDDAATSHRSGGDSGDALVFLFPFSTDNHAANGDGSIHSSVNGDGYFGSDPGGDAGGGGDSGGGDGGGGGGD